jgi:phage FluMu gp28-like protein
MAARALAKRPAPTPAAPPLPAMNPVARALGSTANDRSAPPPALLPYQQAWVADDALLKIGEKSRRIGLTWAEAADDVLIGSSEGGSNVFYIGPTQDMALEYVDAAAMWARAYNFAASEIEEGLFEDIDQDGDTRHIKSYTIRFPGSRKRIVALSSRPTNLRGKQGVVVIDEAAFHGDLKGLLKAAMAMLLWGDKVRILSTHNGADSAFNDLIQEVRAEKRKGKVHRITFRDAVAQGLFKRVCLRRGLEWTPELEAQWVADAYAYYGDDADEELDVVPSQSGGAFLPMALIEARMSADTPLVREKWKGGFALEPEYARRLEIEEWCERELKPHLDKLDQELHYSVGGDCGRVADLSVFCVLGEGKDLVQRCALQVELSTCPFKQQEQIRDYILDRLPYLKAAAFDAAGIGAQMAEGAADKYGALRVEQVKPTEQFYLEQMPKFKAAFQDATIEAIPRDRETRDDLRAIRVINGVPKLPKTKTQLAAGEKLTRHGDAAIALFLAHYAAKRAVVPIEFEQLGRPRQSMQLADFHME